MGKIPCSTEFNSSNYYFSYSCAQQCQSTEIVNDDEDDDEDDDDDVD